MINKITKDRDYHYVGLKRKYGLNDKDGKPIIDEFIESGLEIRHGINLELMYQVACFDRISLISTSSTRV